MMLELLPAWAIMVGLVLTGLLYLRAIRELDRAAGDPVGPVVLTRRERAVIRGMERDLARTVDDDRVPDTEPGHIDRSRESRP